MLPEKFTAIIYGRWNVLDRSLFLALYFYFLFFSCVVVVFKLLSCDINLDFVSCRFSLTGSCWCVHKSDSVITAARWLKILTYTGNVMQYVVNTQAAACSAGLTLNILLKRFKKGAFTAMQSKNHFGFPKKLFSKQFLKEPLLILF